MLITRLRYKQNRTKGFSLTELIIVIAVSSIILVMMSGILTYGIQLWNDVRRTTNAVNLANDLLTEMNDMVCYSYMATISGESETSADFPTWKNWAGIHERLDTMIMCVNYNATTDLRGKIVYQKSYKDEMDYTRYTDLLVIPSRYYGGLYVTNLTFERLQNRSFLVRDESGAEVTDSDTGVFYSLLKISFDVVTSAKLESDNNGFDGHKKLYHAERTVSLENLFSNYNIINEYTTMKEKDNYETIYELLNIDTLDVYDGVWLKDYVALFYTTQRTQSII